MSQTINLPQLHCQKCVESENIFHKNTSVFCCELDLDQRATMKRWLLKWYTVRSGKTITMTIRELLVKLLEHLRQKLPLYFLGYLPVSNIVSTCWPTVEESAIRRQRLDLFMKKKIRVHTHVDICSMRSWFSRSLIFQRQKSGRRIDLNIPTMPRMHHTPSVFAHAVENRFSRLSSAEGLLRIVTSLEDIVLKDYP